MSTVWIDGRIVEGDAATIDVRAAGVQTGFGVFEAMKVVDGRAFALTRHLGRLAESAEIVGISVPATDDELRGAVDVVLAASPGATKVRITVSAGPHPDDVPVVVVNAVTNPPWAPTSKVVVSPWVRNERAPSIGAKTTSYADNLLALAAAKRLGADEAILCDSRGHLSEGSMSNVFVVLEGTLCTPARSNGGLGGMTRELIIELVDTEVRDDLTVADLFGAQEVFLTSSTRGVHPVEQIDDHRVPRAPGPVTRAAAEALADLQARTLDP